MQETKTLACPCGSGKTEKACHGKTKPRAQHFDSQDLDFINLTLTALCLQAKYADSHEHFADMISATRPEFIGRLMEDEDLSSHVSAVLLEHFSLDRQMPSGLTVANEYAGDNPKLTPRQQRALDACRRSHVAAYRIQTIDSKGKARLCDCATGAVIKTSIGTGQQQIKGSTVLARFLPASDNTWRHANCFLLIPPMYETRIHEVLQGGFGTAKKDGSAGEPAGMTPAMTYRSLFVQLMGIWIQAVDEMVPSTNRTFDDDKNEQADLLYAVSSPDTLRRELDAHPDLIRADHHRPGTAAVWRWPRPEPQLKEASLGHLILEGSSLHFEAMSRSRLEAMRLWLDQNITSKLRLRARSILTEADSRARLDASRDSTGRPSDAAITDLRRLIISNLRRTLDEPIRGFPGITVRNAATQVKHQPIVLAWLKDLPKLLQLEAKCSDLDGEEFWHELGLGDQYARHQTKP